MKVHWSAASVKHLHEIAGYLQSESATGAISTRRRIRETVQRVGQMPYSGHTGRIDGTREAVVPRTPYIVTYRISAQAVEILGIWHSARQRPESF
jgi:plasmid stabilization system protein ParE